MMTSASLTNSVHGHGQGQLAHLQGLRSLHLPLSLSERLTKFTNYQFSLISNNHENFSFLSYEESHLRGLKMKDNFLAFRVYHDENCQNLNYEIGELVNYCMNEQSETTNTKRSSIVKVNKKENFAVELYYEDYNCKGIPAKVVNLIDVPEFPGYGECFSMEDDDMGTMYLRADYLSTYPDLDSMPGYYVAKTYPHDMCLNYEENMNYITYNHFPLDMILDGIPLNQCILSGDVYVIYDTTTCSMNGYLTATIYLDSGCTNPYMAIELFEHACLPPAEGDDDDDDGTNDDGDDDDDDYMLANVVKNEYCT